MKKQKIKQTKAKAAKATPAITKRMPFSDVLEKYPEAADVFLRHGMGCFGCPMAMQETIEQGCIAHGLDPNKIVKELNKAIKKRK